MSKQQIIISARSYGLAFPRTVVQVEGEFAYQTANHPDVEAEHLRKVFEILVIESVEVLVEPRTTAGSLD
jgi:hypothetical protein